MPEEITLSGSRKVVRSKSVQEKLYEYWLVSRWLSLDVAAGAMVCCLMASKLLGVHPVPLMAASILGSTVLLIYTIDHLLDIWNSEGRVFSPRRKFHWRYRKLLLPFAVMLSCFLAIVTFVYLPAHVLYFGVALALLVIMYLCLVKQLSVTGGGKWFYKEVLIAVLYTAGTWGVAFSYSTTYGKVAVYLAFAFGLIALQNLLLFSYYEKEEDLRQGQRSMVLQLGSDTVKRLLGFAFVLTGIFLLMAWEASSTSLERQVVLTQALMSGILILLIAFPTYFSRHKRYRWLGDGIFLLPIWLLL
jgi:hypothetical protein